MFSEKEISPLMAFQLLQHNREKIFILDVREEWEYNIVHLPNSIFCPLRKLLSSSLGDFLEEFPDLKETDLILTLCHHGVRSRQGAAWLIQQGFQAVSIQGGIQGWSEEVDHSLLTY